MANGYKFKMVNGKCVRLQRHLMEIHLGRKLTKEEIVHHKDGNILNNDISNLELMNISEHNRLSARNNPPKAKLFVDDIPIIRRMLRDHIEQYIIAFAYGVSKDAIRNLESGKTWAWA